MRTDILIIGAGAVGLGVALAAKQRFPERTVAVLEKNPHEFGETSLYNSGVIHTGVHQRPGLLKSKLAREGSRELVDFCKLHQVPIRQSGMLIVASSRDFRHLAAEVHHLWLLWRNSHSQNLHLHVLSSRGIRELEPEVRASLGIYLEDVWVVDQPALGKKLAATCRSQGIRLQFQTEVFSLIKVGRNYLVETTEGDFSAPIVVNAAGLSADIFANQAGFCHYRHYPWRGEYYEVTGGKANLIQRTLVYPALRPGHPVKGIHLTKPASNNRLLIGPNAKPAGNRSRNSFEKTPPQEFLEGAQRFLPDLEEGDLTWAYAGLRSKTNPAVGEDDFGIHLDSCSPHLVNLIGIESPGLTSCLAIGRYVASMLTT